MELRQREKQRLLARYGEWAIVTGASSGIGFELSAQLAKAGFSLVINGRDEELLAVAEHKLKTNNIQVKTVAADLAKQPGIERLIESTKGLNVGLLVNSAGYGTSGFFLQSSLQSEISLIRVNCEAVLSLTHYFAQRFVQQRRGGIILMSSLVAYQGVPFAANYSASKAYIQSFGEALSEELVHYEVDVLTVAPGPVETNFGPRANMKMGRSIPPSKIGVPILRMLGKRNHVVPGLLSKVLTYSLRTVPRFVKIKIMKNIMGGFTKHQQG